MAANFADWKQAASGLLAIALAGVGAFACSATPPEPNAEGGTLNGLSAQNVDPVAAGVTSARDPDAASRADVLDTSA
jgi:hypothetical protein